MPFLKRTWRVLGKIAIKFTRPRIIKFPKKRKPKSPKKSGGRDGMAEVPSTPLRQEAPPCWGEREIRLLVELLDIQGSPQEVATAIAALERLQAVGVQRAKARPHGKKTHGILHGFRKASSKKSGGRHGTDGESAKHPPKLAPPCWGKREMTRLADLDEIRGDPQAMALAVAELDRMKAVGLKHARASPRGKSNRGIGLGVREEVEDVDLSIFLRQPLVAPSPNHSRSPPAHPPLHH
jgi:hypothetical protein